MKHFLTILSISIVFSIPVSLSAQNRIDTNTYKTIPAGAEYKKSNFYQTLWGKNYRREWATPVTFPITKLDTLRGGLEIYKVGGGNQSKSLRLKNKAEKEYALRSVNKSLDILIPKKFHGTFLQNIANQAISMSHPYGALGVPVMAKAAGLAHTYPQLMWVPKQPAFDTLNEKYGDMLYLFEQRAAGDWSEADNLLNFKKFEDSEELLEDMYDDNKKQVDQVTFVRARLFDMIIGDWDRHWDQWKWGKVEKDGEDIYVPIPTDRDQAFSTTGGLLLKTVISAGGMKYIQPFDHKIKDVTATERRFLDRLVTNKMLLEDWLKEARTLQSLLTDNIIEASIRQMPPAIFAISGNDIIAKLKSRRNDLQKYATDYYKFLAEEVEIVGSKKDEIFEVHQLNDNETSINVFRVNEGKADAKPFYSRVFTANETGELRLFGISGNDVFRINGKANTGLTLRIIGGDKKDSIIDDSNIKLHVYDTDDNTIVKGSRTRLHLSDTTDHKHFYDTYIPDKKGIGPLIGYNREDRLFVGLGYKSIIHKWRRLPFASKQAIGVRFSISQRAPSVFYKGLFPNFIGKWSLLLNADYDAIRWYNFYGIGNETTSTLDDIPFNRSQTREIAGIIGAERKFGKNTVLISGFYQNIKVRNDTERFISKTIAPSQPEIFEANSYAGAQLNYKFSRFNDSIVPTSGFSLITSAAHFQNLTQKTSFERYSGIAQLYIPLISKFSIGIRASGGTTTGNPMYYHLQNIGGVNDLRGYRRERFWGKTAFANSNELRFITNLKSYVMNGKFGLLAFYDQGRVWQPGENSDTWHTDYGAGILLSPFNTVFASVTYAISKERNLIGVRLIKSF